MPSYTVTTKEPFNKMEFTLALRTPFTKDGYEFAGWAFRNNVTGEYLKNEGQIITISAADLEEMAAEVGDSYTIPAEEIQKAEERRKSAQEYIRKREQKHYDNSTSAAREAVS